MRQLALCLALAVASPLASANCLPILGTVKLTHEEPGICTVATINGMSGPFYENNCYSVALKLVGFPPSKGYAGLTREMISSQYETGAAASPATLQDRTLLTARSTFVLGHTRFYAAEVIIDSGGGLVTEQGVITGTDGKGLFKNATGGFTILGDSINEVAQIRGQICKK